MNVFISGFVICRKICQENVWVKSSVFCHGISLFLSQKNMGFSYFMLKICPTVISREEKILKMSILSILMHDLICVQNSHLWSILIFIINVQVLILYT
jgi:hypothetical protein